jgi:hypothetical protein
MNVADPLNCLTDNAATNSIAATNVSLPQISGGTLGRSKQRVMIGQKLPSALLSVRRQPRSTRWHLAVDDIVNKGGLLLEHVVGGLLRHHASGDGLTEVRL